MKNSCDNFSKTQTNNQSTRVIIPNTPMRWTCCAECYAGSYDERREEVWCGKYRQWYSGSDGCSSGPNG